MTVYHIVALFCDRCVLGFAADDVWKCPFCRLKHQCFNYYNDARSNKHSIHKHSFQQCVGIAQSVKQLTKRQTVRGSNAGGGEIFCTRPDRLCTPPSLLYNGYRFSLSGIKRPGRGVHHPPPSSAKLKKEQSYTSTSILAFMACSRANFTFAFFQCATAVLRVSQTKNQFIKTVLINFVVREQYRVIEKDGRDLKPL